MQTPVLLAFLIVLLPFAAWLVEFGYAFGRRRLPDWADKLSTAAILGSMGLSVYLLFTEVLFTGIETPYSWSTTWFSIGEGASAFQVGLDVLVDNLTVVMYTVVSIVAGLVHVYSRGYMHGEERYPRFFFYLSLFSFSMLGLCTTGNLLVLFVFWELVGVCSYFLIGFFIRKRSAGDAAKKAFVVNRVGDACFMFGIALIFSVLSGYYTPVEGAEVLDRGDGTRVVRVDGSEHVAGPATGWQVVRGPGGDLEARRTWAGSGVLSFQRIWESVGLLGGAELEGTGSPAPDRGPWGGSQGLLLLAGLLVFAGCITKSAQFPLHVWLPDAMEGPTPVSALIHAATMVIAGVYMICRMFPLLAGEGYLAGDYFSSPVLWVVAGTGSVTALFAGTVAIAQTDLKKGLAYSTVSQLGFMTAAVGVGSITAALFHLFTHAFFKACLFLGSGSVIHAVHSQEMSDMGGLRRKMPVTHATFLISCMAIAGVPFFSGFLSKEAILGQAGAFGMWHGSLLSWLPFVILAVTALLTAFYMWRLLFLTFYGPPGDPGRFEHAHESPRSMTVPLVVLAVLAIVAGGIALPVGMEATGGHWFQERVNDSTVVQAAMAGPEGLAGTEAGRRLYEGLQVHRVHAHDPGPGANETVSGFWEGYHALHWPLLAWSLFAAGSGIALAWFFFVSRRGVDFVSPFRPLAAYRNILRNLYFVDWFYTNRVVPTCKDIASVAHATDKRIIDGAVHFAAWCGRSGAWLAGKMDASGVDGAVDGIGWLMMRFGQGVRNLVTGRIQDYLRYTVIGMAVLFILVSLL